MLGEDKPEEWRIGLITLILSATRGLVLDQNKSFW